MTRLLIILIIVSRMIILNAQEPNNLPNPAIKAELAVRVITPARQIMNERDWYRAIEEVHVYNAPDGIILDVIPVGSNYFTAIHQQNGWLQVASDEWIPAHELEKVYVISDFTGFIFPDIPLEYPLGWVLKDSSAYETPSENAHMANGQWERYDIVALHDTDSAREQRWVNIGDQSWVPEELVAEAVPIERPHEIDTHKWIGVDLGEQILIAYEGERPVFATLVSTGLPDWETNPGLFHIYVRTPSTRMSAPKDDPDYYYLQDVPYTMFFDNEIALHGTIWHDSFGSPQSHGCVNLSLMDSFWLYTWASSEFDAASSHAEGIAVYVYDSTK